jgi:hypothetical protein
MTDLTPVPDAAVGMLDHPAQLDSASADRTETAAATSL